MLNRPDAKELLACDDCEDRPQTAYVLRSMGAHGLSHGQFFCLMYFCAVAGMSKKGHFPVDAASHPLRLGPAYSPLPLSRSEGHIPTAAETRHKVMTVRLCSPLSMPPM